MRKAAPDVPVVTLREAFAILLDLEWPALNPAPMDSPAVAEAKARERSRLERWVRCVLVDYQLAEQGTSVLTRGVPRLFSAVDIALVRLAWRFKQRQVSAWRVRAALTYVRDEIANRWLLSVPESMRIDGLNVEFDSTRPLPGDDAVWLPAVWRGVAEAVVAVRHDQPCVAVRRGFVDPRQLRGADQWVPA